MTDNIVVPGKPLGRKGRHDPRSLAYLVPENDSFAVSAEWTRRVPVFDQGDVGSCTGNAAAGVLGTDPFYATVGTLDDDESEALKLYSAAEVIDGDGPYPPNDQGSSGLSVAQAAKNAGLISGYQHITSVAAAQTAITRGPFIVGSDWYEGMDDPNSEGYVNATGQVRGGHEYECFKYDAAADRWWFYNSWGDSFGANGTFCYSSATFAKLLASDGDATTFVPITSPPPIPQPPQPPPVVDAPFLDCPDGLSARITQAALKAGLSITDYQVKRWNTYFHIKAGS